MDVLSNPYCCAFVGNLAFNVKVDDIRKILSGVGQVVNFELVTTADYQSKGYGFCEYRDKQVVEAAVTHLNGIVLNGRRVMIDYAWKLRNLKLIDNKILEDYSQYTETKIWEIVNLFIELQNKKGDVTVRSFLMKNPEYARVRAFGGLASSARQKLILAEYKLGMIRKFSVPKQPS